MSVGCRAVEHERADRKYNQSKCHWGVKWFMAQLQNALMDIGTIGLPPVVSGLSSLASALKIIKTGLDFLPSWAKESALDQFKNAGVAVDDLRKMVLPSIFSPASAGEAAIRSAPYMGRDPRSSMDHPYIPAVTSPQIS